MFAISFHRASEATKLNFVSPVHHATLTAKERGCDWSARQLFQMLVKCISKSRIQCTCTPDSGYMERIFQGKIPYNRKIISEFFGYMEFSPKKHVPCIQNWISVFNVHQKGYLKELSKEYI